MSRYSQAQAKVTLQPQSEHLVGGKLPASAVISVGSTVIVDPTQSKTRPKHILIGRIITPLWGDGSIQLKIINLTNETIVLRRNAKIADVSPCITIEDSIQSNVHCAQSYDTPSRTKEEMHT